MFTETAQMLGMVGGAVTIAFSLIALTWYIVYKGYQG